MKSYLKIFLCILIYLGVFLRSTKIYALEDNQYQVKQEQSIIVDENINLYVGESFSLDVQLVEETDITYTDYDSSIISIDEKGVITALKDGQTQLTITTQETDLYSSENKTINIKVSKKKQNIIANDITMTYNDKKEIKVESNHTELQYIVKDKNILEVDNDGNIITKSIGKTTVEIIALESNEYEVDRTTINIKVTSSLSKPNISQYDIDSTNQAITITWDEVNLADGYLIYCKTDNSKWILEADTPSLQYIKENIVSSTKYQFKIIAYKDNQNDKSEATLTKTIGYLDTPSLSLSKNEKGIQIQWNQITSANSYQIYKYSNQNWSLLKTVKSLNYIDTNTKNGNVYDYKIKAISSFGESQYSTTKQYGYLSKPTIKTCQKSNTILNIKWNKLTNIDGYQIQYSTNSLFTHLKTLTINKNTTSKQIKNLSKKAKYYVRLRSYKTIDNIKYYSSWSTSSNISKTKKATVSSIKINNKKLELRGLSKQKLYQYDTVQGGCSDGTYAYYVLYNRKVEKCKIVKIKISNFKLIKVSHILNIAHGNDITYNSTTNKLIVVHTENNPYRISIVNPNTLTIEKSQDIKLTSHLLNMSTQDIKSSTGFSAIAYNEKREQYVMLMKSSKHIAILDKNMKAVKYLKPQIKDKQVIQGIDVTNEYILIGQSPSKNKPYNIISVYDWEGNYIQKINIIKGYELENIFHIKNQFYATFYTSYYKTYYTYQTKERIVNGKKKKVKIKTKHKKLMRDNYVYKLNAI